MIKQLPIALSLLIYSTYALAQAPARCVFSGSIRLESNHAAVQQAQLFISDSEPVRGRMDANWSSSTTDGEGNFRIDLKGQANYLRIIRVEGDTVDLSLAGVQCNTHRDITIALLQEPAVGCTYVVGDMPHILPEVTLQAYSSRSSPNRIPASVAFIPGQILNNNDQSSLQPALNTIPGVIMESRGYGGSHRLNIRGSSLRSPFAVRNVKMYLDGVPLTGADGQTPLELIDAADIASIEIIKGPAGSMYGSGNGGVLLLRSAEIDSGEVNIQSGIQAASFGGYRANTTVAAGFKTSQLRISHNWQEYDGFREQEFNRKQQLSLSLKQQLNAHQQLTLWGTYYNGNWGLPGSLTKEQADSFPRQAIPYSVLNNASLQRERWVRAISQSGQWGQYFDHFITLNYHKAHKVNPYGTSAFNSGFKNENSESLSGRAVGNFRRSWSDFKIQFNAGAEWQTETYSILEQSISLGEPQDFKYFYDIGYRQAMMFTQSDLNWKELFFITGGFSYNNNEQFVRGRNASEFHFDTTTTWGKTFLPRLALSIQPFKGLFLYRSYSAGVANPTVFEMIDQENNTYNLALTSERGNLHELGVKHHAEELHLDYSLALYHFEITDAILPYSMESTSGESIQLFHNAGSTIQRGLEWMLKYESRKNANTMSIAIWNNGTVNNHRFAQYEVNQSILNGNRIPGIPLTQMNSGVQLQMRGFSFSLIDYWTDRMPADNGNSTWTPAYHLLNVMTSYRFELMRNFECSVHAGINNLFDSNYSSFLSLNATGSRYYNPSAPINFFCGMHLRYTLEKN